MKAVKILFILGLSLWPAFLSAQTIAANINFERITSRSGLSSNEVNFIFNDSRGYIWICTGSGLNRYDGISFKKFYHNEANANSIADDEVFNMAEDELHHLWIATKRGVSCYDPETGLFKNYLTADDEGKKINASRFSVMADDAHTIWAASNFFVSKYDRQHDHFIHYPVDVGQQGSASHYDIYTPFEDSKRRLWLPTSHDVQLFDPKTGKAILYPFKDTPKGGFYAVTVMNEDSAGNIYAGTWGAGVLKLNEKEKYFERINFGPPDKKEVFAQNIIQDILFTGNTAYFATRKGLLKIPVSYLQPGTCLSGFSIWCPGGRDKESGLNILSAVMKDRAGTIWIGGAGIMKIDPRKAQFSTLHLQDDEQQRLLSPVVFAAAPGGGADNYFFAAYDLYKVTNGKTEKRPVLRSFPDPAFAAIWDISSGNGSYWLGTTAGLMKTDTAGKVTGTYFPSERDSNSILKGTVWKVYSDSKGDTWCGTLRNGISRLEKGSGRFINYFSNKNEEYSLAGSTPVCFFEDHYSNIWFGAANHLLYKYDRKADRFLVYPFMVRMPTGKMLPFVPNPYAEDTAGNILVGTTGGIIKFDPRGDTVAGIMVHGNFPLTNGHCILKDHSGKTWMATTSGLWSFDPAKGRLRNYTEANGLESTEDINGINLMPDGSLLAGGERYITGFNPGSMQDNAYPPPVVIVAVRVNGRDTSLTGNISLPYHTSLDFEFAALNYTDPANNSYRYMLEGADRVWTEPGDKRSVTYADLPPGKYTFKVKGSNNDGVWNESPACFTFTIATPFYRSWWFLILCGLLLFGVIYMLYRYRVNKILEMEKLRMRIATDLHDDIGATLSSISMYSQSIKDRLKGQNPQLENVLDRMGRNSRDMVTGMSDMVWAINPKNDDGGKLQMRMDSFATDICAAGNIQLHFENSNSLEGLSLSLAQRKNIYLIFKEAVNNAVKYSGAKNIRIGLTFSGKQLELKVSDDGKGFDAVNGTRGNGLNNMYSRAKEIKGQLQIRSVPGAGTEIILTCKY